MCSPTNKIKLCTCETLVKPKTNFWVLLTKKKTKEFIVGEVTFDYRSIEKSYIQIHKEIEHQLNDHYPFDKPIEIKKADILKIITPTDNNPNGETFSFIFQNSKWKAFVSDFLTEYNYKTLFKGGVENVK